MPEVFNSKPKHNKHRPGTPNVTKHRDLPPELRHQLEGYSKNPLSAFCYYPTHTHFIGADAQEKIVLLLRKHPITNVPWIFLASIMLILPLFLSFVPSLTFLPFGFQLILGLFWYMALIAFILEQFLSWFFNVYIVTDERVFDVDFHNLVYREITDANLDQIQDVTVTVGSVIRTVFDYGNVTIQTAAQIPQIDFGAVPHPDKVAQVLRELRVEEEIERIEGRVR